MSKFPLLSVIGIEIEYMIVDDVSLDIQAKSDLILHRLAGGNLVNEVALDEIAVSNELVMHVIELKNNGPKPPSHPIAQAFQSVIQQLDSLLKEDHLRLLPTGAHPWMNPLLETKRWPYGKKDIYQQYDKIFNCQGHGWANLQSMHVNLPFANDEEFSQLHNTIRLLLPLLPALAASSPFLDGCASGILDRRLEFYEKNQQSIPSISGNIIPDFINSQQDYENKILKPMYQDIQVVDPKGTLQHEWLNSRAAIPKFDCQAIEIRILDTQECINADIAIAKAIHAILTHWYETGSHVYREKIYPTEKLKALYNQSYRTGLGVASEDKAILEQWQLTKLKKTSLRDIWTALIEQVSSKLDETSQKSLEHILSQGNLSERLLKACQHDLRKDKLKELYQQLGDCLVKNQLYSPL